jgi:hypothetical protein
VAEHGERPQDVTQGRLAAAPVSGATEFIRRRRALSPAPELSQQAIPERSSVDRVCRVRRELQDAAMERLQREPDRARRLGRRRRRRKEEHRRGEKESAS